MPQDTIEVIKGLEEENETLKLTNNSLERKNVVLIVLLFVSWIVASGAVVFLNDRSQRLIIMPKPYLDTNVSKK